jgi:hypothetical protein
MAKPPKTKLPKSLATSLPISAPPPFNQPPRIDWGKERETALIQATSENLIDPYMIYPSLNLPSGV